jgi:peptidoglycan-associated lipoprotein
MKGKGDGGGAVENVKEEQMASADASPSTGGSPAKEPRGTLISPSTPRSGSTPNSTVAPGNSGVASGAPDTTSLGDIFFDFDQYNIRKDAQPVLEGDARWLRNEQGKSLLIEGHCDERGTLAYNLVLGEKRAKSAKRYLEDLGISGSRIQTTSYGEVRPFCKDHNEGCWSKNQRAHFVIQ